MPSNYTSGPFTFVSGGQPPASGLTVSSGLFFVLDSGGVAYATTVLSNGQFDVGAGCSASGTILSGGSEIINYFGSSGTSPPLFGLDTGALIYAGGTQDVHGRSVDAAVSSGGLLLTDTYGVTSGAMLYSSGSQTVGYASEAVRTTVNSGGAQTVSMGTASGTVLNSGGVQSVHGGGLAYGTSVGGGGVQSVDLAGSASSTVVSDGGLQMVAAYGTADATSVGSGGVQLVADSLASVSGTVVQAGGRQTVNGIAVATTIEGGGVQVVNFNGVTTGTVIDSGGLAVVEPFGSASNTTVDAGGTIVLLPGALDPGFNPLAGADVVNGGVVVLTADGLPALISSGVVPGVVVGGAGAMEYVWSGGTATASLIGSGASQGVYAGGVASATMVASGGQQDVFASGATYGTTLSGGARAIVWSGGTTHGDAVGAGGEEDVASSGVASFTTVASGGVLAVNVGGSAVGTLIASGGDAIIQSGAVASLTTLAVGGSISLPDLVFSGGQPVISGDVLTVTQGSSTDQIVLSGTYTSAVFTAAADPSNFGTEITLDSVSCYGRGSRILTLRGAVPVEALRLGERVRTVLGARDAPIVWLGRREVDCAGAPHPGRVWPVRVAAGAFGPGLPAADLTLSPDHAVYVNCVLIPIRYLINGGSIAQCPVDRVEYWHFALRQHGVVLAEGLPAESFLDIRNGQDYGRDPGPARMWDAEGCAKLVVAGPELAAARALVHRHAGRAAA